jgi:hypothetical protein
MVLQHLYRGHGLALLDPHGDLADELLDHFPSWRADDLVYFNPSDLDFPISLNLLANVPPDDRHLVASGITAAFKSIWRDSWGPRMEYILYNALVALLDCQNASLLGVNRMLTDTYYRAWVVRQVKDPFVRNFWSDEFAGYDARFVREAIGTSFKQSSNALPHRIDSAFANSPSRGLSFSDALDTVLPVRLIRNLPLLINRIILLSGATETKARIARRPPCAGGALRRIRR